MRTIVFALAALVAVEAVIIKEVKPEAKKPAADLHEKSVQEAKPVADLHAKSATEVAPQLDLHMQTNKQGKNAKMGKKKMKAKKLKVRKMEKKGRRRRVARISHGRGSTLTQNLTKRNPGQVGQRNLGALQDLSEVFLTSMVTHS